MKNFKKILIVIPIIAILICSICLPVSAAGVPSTDGNLNFVGLGVIKNVTTGKTFTPTSSSSAFKSSTYFSNAIEIGSYTSSVYCSAVNNVITYQVWIDPTKIGSYTFWVAMKSEYWDLASISLDYSSVANNISNVKSSIYSDITKNGVSFTRLKVTFDCNSLDKTDLGYTGDYFTIRAYSDKSDYSYSDLRAFFYDITVSDSTDEIIQNQTQNTEDIIDNQNSNTQAEIEADKENTQAIIDNQNQLAEQEKQEVTDSGNDSVDSATEAIPDYDFFEAIGVFVDSLGSTDTEFVIDIPRIYIPKVAMIPETTLYKGGTFNFNTVIDMIPDKILLLVQYILTVALIIYGCKEFYDLIFKSVDGVSKIGDDT